MDDFFEDGLTSGFVDFMVEEEDEEERRRRKLEKMLNPDYVDPEDLGWNPKEEGEY